MMVVCVCVEHFVMWSPVVHTAGIQECVLVFSCVFSLEEREIINLKFMAAISNRKVAICV
jgi:hypothetical protein